MERYRKDGQPYKVRVTHSYKSILKERDAELNAVIREDRNDLRGTLASLNSLILARDANKDEMVALTRGMQEQVRDLVYVLRGRNGNGEVGLLGRIQALLEHRGPENHSRTEEEAAVVAE